MVNVDVRTRVELKNETQRTNARKGRAGKIALIGAFPNGKQRIYAAENFGQVVNHYGVKLNSTAVNWYGGVRAAKRMFMEGIKDYAGASSITCVNICKLTPNEFKDLDMDETLYKDTYSEDETLFDVATNTEMLLNAGTINGENKYIPTNETIKKDTTLTFEKLKIALQQIADEDMDILFIANDLWEILDSPHTKSWQEYPVASTSDMEYTKSDGKTLKEGFVGHTILAKKGTHAPSLILNADGTYGLKCPFKVGDDGKFIKENGTNVRITPEDGLKNDETFYPAVFVNTEANPLGWKDGPEIYNKMKTINHLVLDTKAESNLETREQVTWEALPVGIEGNTSNGKFNEQYVYSEERFQPFYLGDEEVSVTNGETGRLELNELYESHTILVKSIDGKLVPSLVLNHDGTFGFKNPFQVNEQGEFIKIGGNKVPITTDTGLSAGETPKSAIFLKSALAGLSNGINNNEPRLSWEKPSVYTTSGIVDALVLNEAGEKVEFKATSTVWEDYPIAHSSDYEARDSETGEYKEGAKPHTIIARRTKTGTHIPSIELNEDGTYALKYPFKRDKYGDTIKNGSSAVLLDKTPDALGCKLNADEVAFTAVFNGTNEELGYPNSLEDKTKGKIPTSIVDTDGKTIIPARDENDEPIMGENGKYVALTPEQIAEIEKELVNNMQRHLAVKWYKTVFQTAKERPNNKALFVLNKLFEPTDDLTQELVTWEAVATDSNGNEVYGITDKGKFIRNIGDVYDYILDFIDNEFTNHRPVNYVGAVKTRAIPEGNETYVSSLGIGSKVVRVNGIRYDYESEPEAIALRHTPSTKNPYADIKEWGAVDIANLFTRTTNELSTCGLFYQSGIIAGEEVDAMELAAHMVGWICSINISQDLTYQTIPALTAVNEEPFLGTSDAGTLLNQAGIQIIRPKSRLNKTFYINNSIQPTGWHTNHIRTVTYLLKRLQFENGLGINNFITNTEAYRAALESVAKEVMDEIDLIREVDIGEVDIISNYELFVPVTIILSGVVTIINVGVGMALDETGKLGTYIKSTSGYSVHV